MVLLGPVVKLHLLSLRTGVSMGLPTRTNRTISSNGPHRHYFSQVTISFETIEKPQNWKLSNFCFLDDNQLGSSRDFHSDIENENKLYLSIERYKLTADHSSSFGFGIEVKQDLEKVSAKKSKS